LAETRFDLGWEAGRVGIEENAGRVVERERRFRRGDQQPLAILPNELRFGCGWVRFFILVGEEHSNRPNGVQILRFE
jgi:hypothetical protein